MRVLRLLLFLLMGFLLLAMAGCPGLYDSRRSFIAHAHNYDAPSEATRIELEQAKRLERSDIMVFELVMGGVFALAVYAFMRAGRKAQAHAAYLAGWTKRLRRAEGVIGEVGGGGWIPPGGAARRRERWAGLRGCRQP